MTTMPKTRAGKRKVEAAGGGPKPKRQRAAPASKAKAGKTSTKRRKSQARTPQAAPGIELTLSDLPDNVLANVFGALGLDRLRAMQVCKRWQRVGSDPCFTRIVTDQIINDTISQANPGDTIELKPGFYQEVVLVEKPLKFVGQPGYNVRGRKHKDVVLQSNRSMAVMCNARACFENMVIRTILPGADRSMVGFGPECGYIALHECDLGGVSGLLVPRTKPKDTTLKLQGCYIHGVAHMAAVTMEGGNLRMEECTLTNCQVGLNVHEGVCVVLRNNDISFNEVGLIFDGYGIIQDNKMWGNLHRSTIDLGKEALARAKEKPPGGAFEQLLAAYHAELAEQSTCAAIVDPTAEAGVDQPGSSAPQPAEAAGSAEQAVAPAEQDGGATAHVAARRSGVPAPIAPPLYISGNHIQRPQRLRKLSEDQQRLRRKVRKLAAEVYGAHEQNGEWNDEGEWHVVGDEDLESSDDDLLGSDVESSSDDDGEDGDLDLVGDESSGDDFDSEEESEDEDGVPLGHMSSDEETSEDNSSDGGSHTEHTDDSMHTSDFETSQDESSDEEAAQQQEDQAPQEQ